MTLLRGPRLDALWDVFQACRRAEVAWAEEVASWTLLRGSSDEFGLARYRAARERTALARTMLNLEQHGTFDSPYDPPAPAPVAVSR